MNVKTFLAALLVFFIAACAGFMWWFNARRREAVVVTHAAREDGLRFGKEATERECVQQALSRYAKDQTELGAVAGRIWLYACLEEAKGERHFCDEVPNENDTSRSAAWRHDRCADAGLPKDPLCPNILEDVSRYCYGGDHAAKLPAP